MRLLLITFCSFLFISFSNAQFLVQIDSAKLELLPDGKWKIEKALKATIPKGSMVNLNSNGQWAFTNTKGLSTATFNGDYHIISNEDGKWSFEKTYPYHVENDKKEKALLKMDGTWQQVSGTMTDTRNNKQYSYIQIDTLYWMSENLQFEIGNNGTLCYGAMPKNCEDYGMIYRWPEAQNACPAGWRLPTKNEFDALVKLGHPGNEYLKGGKVGVNLQMAGSYSQYAKRFLYRDRVGTYWSSDAFTDKQYNILMNQGLEVSSFYNPPRVKQVDVNTDEYRSIRCVKKVP